MARKKKQEWMSFVEDGQRWMLCKKCQSEYCKVSSNTAAVTCSRCVVMIDLIKFPDTLPKSSIKKTTGRPAGWHWMKEFVDKDGNVFHKGTLKPTVVKPRKKKKKLTADQKLFKKAAEHKKKIKAKRKSK